MTCQQSYFASIQLKSAVLVWDRKRETVKNREGMEYFLGRGWTIIGLSEVLKNQSEVERVKYPEQNSVQ